MTPPAATTTELAPPQHPELWVEVVGQERAIHDLEAALESPVHAYLFVGPRGSGKRALARGFAAGLLRAGFEGEERERQVKLALEGRHPDVVLVERVGASITVDQAAQVRDQAARAPVESDRKVLILDEFHLVQNIVAPRLLKTIEEPPPGRFFIVLAEDVPEDLITIESRCVRLDLGPVAPDAISARLEQEGIDSAVARSAADASAGDMGRARVLATDERLSLRRQLWHDAPTRLDGTGHRVVQLVDELLAAIEDAAEPLKARQAADIAELEARVEEYGERGAGRGKLTDRHKRELRRHRTDEIRFGLAVLGRRYRDAMATAERPAPYIEAISAIEATNYGFLEHNPNERLQLLALFLKLPTLT